jgi:hypothetical protein
MTSMNVPAGTATGAQGDRLEVYTDEPETGAGWLIFAGTVLGLAGFMRIIDSIWAFAYSGALPENLKDGLIGSDLNNYGWLWLVVGVVLLTASVMILVRSQVARWVGYLAATIGALSAMTWMPYYPVWSLLYIGMSVAVFYALAKYGGRESA